MSQAVSLVHIRHLEADKKDQDCTVFFNHVQPKAQEAYIEPEPEYQPVQSFEDALNGEPEAELFPLPQVADAKTKKRK